MKRYLLWTLAVLSIGRIWRKSRKQTTSPSLTPPGEDKTRQTRFLELGSALLQNRSPIEAFNLYLDGFHPQCGDISHQMEAHHYCTSINEDVIQCAIFDGNTPDAKLIGVEYVISERLFKTLPIEERRLWHSHHYEVKAGQLIAPGIPELAEHQLMQKLVRTYGKTWHTWDSNRDHLPLGIPSLMMGFTEDGQIDAKMNQARDRRFGVSTEDKRRQRLNIPTPTPIEGANSWQTGQAPILKLATESTDVPQTMSDNQGTTVLH